MLFVPQRDYSVLWQDYLTQWLTLGGNMTTTDIKEAFTRFQGIVQEWNNLTSQNLLFSDSMASGEEYRRIGKITTLADLEKAKALIKKWESFVEIFSNSSDKWARMIPKNSYLPVPTVLHYNESTAIKLARCTTSRTYSRERIMDMYHRALNLQKVSPLVGTTRKTLIRQLENFSNDPPFSIYRVRWASGLDVAIKTGVKSHEKYRVSTYGAIIYTPIASTEIIIKDRTKVTSETHYTRTKPIPCAVVTGSKVYRLNDIDDGEMSIKVLCSVQSRFRTRYSGLKRAELFLKSRRKYIHGIPEELQTKINELRKNIDRLNEMDSLLLKVMKNKDKYYMTVTLNEARKLFGEGIEKEYGMTFDQAKALIGPPLAAFGREALPL